MTGGESMAEGAGTELAPFRDAMIRPPVLQV